MSFSAADDKTLGKMSSVPEHDIVSQATALQKEYRCDLSSTAKHDDAYSPQLCRERIGWGLAQGLPKLAPPCLAGSAGAVVPIPEFRYTSCLSAAWPPKLCRFDYRPLDSNITTSDKLFTHIRAPSYPEVAEN